MATDEADLSFSVASVLEEFIRKETKQREIDLASRKAEEDGMVFVVLILWGLILISLILLY